MIGIILRTNRQLI